MRQEYRFVELIWSGRIHDSYKVLSPIKTRGSMTKEKMILMHVDKLLSEKMDVIHSGSINPVCHFSGPLIGWRGIGNLPEEAQVSLNVYVRMYMS